MYTVYESSAHGTPQCPMIATRKYCECKTKQEALNTTKALNKNSGKYVYTFNF